MNDLVCKFESLSGPKGASGNSAVSAESHILGSRSQVQPEGPLKITGELSIRTVGELREEMCAYAGRGAGLVVDLSEVHACDTAALQLIYSLRNTAAQCNQPFRIAAVSPPIEEIAATLGLRISELFGADGAGDLHAESGETDGGI